MRESDEVHATSRRSADADRVVPDAVLPLATQIDPFPPPPHAPIRYEIRACRLSDLNDLRHLRPIALLSQPESLLQPFSAFRMGMRASLRWPRRRRRVIVAQADDRVVGCAVFQPIRPDHRWRVVALGAMTGVHDSGPVLQDLLTHGILLAGLNGVKRLYARVPDGSPVRPSLAAAGFSSYASETLLVATVVPPRKVPGRMRAQELVDTWAIHQLYNAAVPRQVQYAEALTSHFWDIGTARAAEPFDVMGWVIEEGHHIVGHARITSRGGDHVIDLIAHPDRPDILDDLVDGALAQLSGRTVRRVYCAVRGYQEEIRTVLDRRAFLPLHDQELQVKYTTVNVRQPAMETVPLRADVREKVPKRVPTFLQGQPGDDGAR